MVTLLISLTEEQHKKLKQIYMDTGQRLTETVRRALDEYFSNQQK